MATVPLSGTNIRLLSSVPFSNDYKHTRWFPNAENQANYFSTRPVVHQISEANFQRIEGYNFIACNKSIDELWGTNYLMFRNSAYSNKWFYAFVTKLEYIQKNTTYVHFEIDVLQTWRFQFNFKPSMVVREHRPMWNSDGSPIINTVDEGLDYGDAYQTVYVNEVKPEKEIFFLVITTKSLIHKSGDLEPNTIVATLNGSPQPLSYYIHPFKMNGDRVSANIGGSGTELSSIQTLLSNIYSQEDAVNNIVSLYVTEQIGVDVGYPSDGKQINLPGDKFELAMIASDTGAENISTIYVQDLPFYHGKKHEFGDKYYGFRQVEESKLLMYPYAMTMLVDFKGNQFEVKNENIYGNNLNVLVRGSMGTSNKVSYTIPEYLLPNETLITDNAKDRISLDHGFINVNPQDVPIITDMLSAYLQGNRNSLENQTDSIMFNGAMGAVNGATNFAGNVAGGNIGGAVGGITETVGGLGNTVLALQGLQAKQKDINNTPPQLAKMGSNTAFDYGYSYAGFYIIKKQIKSEYRDRLTDFFKMFGYKINRLKIPNFHTRKSFNYIQTLDCNITGNLNNEDLQDIKNIFNNGVTLWHSNDVGNYSLENEVI